MSSNYIQHIRNQIVEFYDKKKQQQRQDYLNTKNKRWEKYYHNHAWNTLRNSYFTAHPCCEVCDKQGIVTATEEVHHIFPFGRAKSEEMKWKLLLNPNNLVSCCSYHHKLFHKYMKDKHVDHAYIDEIIDYEKELPENNKDFL